MGYRDICDVPKQFDILPFTNNVAEAEKFISNVRATGGGDTCEDLDGALC